MESANLPRTAILRYLEDHPDARDSVEGIAAWWLPRGHSWTNEEIEQDLRELVQSQRVMSWRLTAGPELYGLPIGSATRRGEDY